MPVITQVPGPALATVPVPVMGLVDSDAAATLVKGTVQVTWSAAPMRRITRWVVIE